MPTKEQLFAEAHPEDFLFGISLARRIKKGLPVDPTPTNVKDAINEEIAQWSNAVYPDVITPFAISRMTAVELGANVELEELIGAKK